MGISGYVDVGDKPLLEGNATWTFAAWINPDAFNSSRDTWLMYQQNVLQWGMLSGASRQLSVNIGGGGNNSLQGAVTNNTQLSSNAWTHVAVTYTNSTVKFYVNGVLADTFTKTYTMGSNNNKDFSISTANQSFDGKLDDVRYYNRAVSDTEMAGVYGQSLTNAIYLADALGSIVALADSNKVIQTEYDYEPFGATTTTGAGNKNSYKFTAREDDGTGIYHYRARYYHPALGRFASEDPLEYSGGSFDLYSYVANNPMSYTDALGLLFMRCQRDIQGEGFWGGVVNAFGGSHTYVVYYPMGGREGRLGWGFGGGMQGGLPQKETLFNSNRCVGCKRTTSPLKYGVGAGKPGTAAADFEIADCIKNRPFSHNYSFDKYNCRDWANEATKDCGLDCN